MYTARFASEYAAFFCLNTVPYELSIVASTIGDIALLAENWAEQACEYCFGQCWCEEGDELSREQCSASMIDG